ncbi:hypothetical protein [Streptomonospora alba]|uniref:hypothetical protein n=1 Tax=Streptomonospora alba TaxID=183763 RepID=UPI0006997A2B|nr:hypothetical protein [Streptomonospora alba]
MNQRFLGVLIGSAFGAVFVFANSGAPMPPDVTLAARVAAAAALAATVLLGLAASRGDAAADSRSRPPAARNAAGRWRGMFKRGFAGVVFTEGVLLIGGFRAIRVFGAPPETNVAWIAVVVGLHFVALVAVWKAPSVAVPGAVLTALGVAGFALAALSLTPWVPVVSGVLSGVTLLVCGVAATAAMWVATRRA